MLNDVTTYVFLIALSIHCLIEMFVGNEVAKSPFSLVQKESLQK